MNRMVSEKFEVTPKVYDSSILISLVVPVLNEESLVERFINRVNEVFSDHSNYMLELIFVDDGSTDSTINRLLKLQEHNKCITIVELTRNFGKEAALTAGIFNSTGDVVVPIDVDLQDPPEIILSMLDKWREGFEVVLGCRIDRSSDSRMKRISANWFYRAINKISKVKIPENVGDFRLMDRAVVDALKLLPENHRFMKGLFAWLGFKTSTVEYIRPERFAGETNFNGFKLWTLALEGITSFSLIPLKIWSYIGLFFSLFSLGYAAFIFFKTIFFGISVPGYASLMITITFIGGLQLMGIGIIGEYLGRTYIESKRRPIYLTRKIHRNED